MRTYRVYLPKNDFGTGKVLGEFTKYLVKHFMRRATSSVLSRTPVIEVYELKFKNGYGASVIQGDGTYGNPKGNTWELAILNSKGRICYTTGITKDVVGWLKPYELRNMLAKIEALPKEKAKPKRKA